MLSQRSMLTHVFGRVGQSFLEGGDHAQNHSCGNLCGGVAGSRCAGWGCDP
jgi:hypothetical protein